MAVAFAEMHDTPVRMVAKGVLHGIVPWAQARPFLATRLRRRCAPSVLMCLLPPTSHLYIIITAACLMKRTATCVPIDTA